METKTCTQCGETKSVSEFILDKRTPGKYRSNCKACKAAYAREWGQRNRERQRVRMRQYRQDNLEHFREVETKRRIERHGLTVTRYDEMYEDQKGLCALCVKREVNVIDHDHTCCPGTYSCGQCVRGLLCHSCNRALGFLGDDPETIARIIKYLS